MAASPSPPSSSARAARRRCTTISPGDSSASIAASRTRSSISGGTTARATTSRTSPSPSTTPSTPGDFYTLLPENDIHRVRTTSDITSVSLHLLGNDNGCIARRQYVPEEKVARPFRSGYLNIKCADGETRAAPNWDEVHESLERLAAV